MHVILQYKDIKVIYYINSSPYIVDSMCVYVFFFSYYLKKKIPYKPLFQDVALNFDNFFFFEPIIYIMPSFLKSIYIHRLIIQYSVIYITYSVVH